MTILAWGGETANTAISGDVASDERDYDVTGLEDDGYVVTYVHYDSDASIYRAYFQRYNAVGNLVTGETEITGVGTDIREVSVTALANGGFTIFYSYYNGSNYDTAAQIRDASGAVVNTFSVDAGSGDERMPAIEGLGTGFVIAQFDSDSGSGNDIWIKKFNADGTPAISFVNVTNSANSDFSPCVATFQDQSHVAVSWIDNGTGSIKLRIYDSNLANPGTTLTVVNITTDTPPAITGIGNDQVVVTWHQPISPTSYDVYYRIYGSDGTLIKDTTRANDQTGGLQARQDITATADGGFMITYDDTGYTGLPRQIAARLFDVDGNPIGTQVRVGSTGESAIDSKITALADGRVVVIWEENGVLHQQIVDPRDGLINGDANANLMYGHDLLDDQISGFGSSDILLGLGGNDDIYGGDGRDRLYGNSGEDHLYGGQARDTLYGGSDDDYLDGGIHNDALYGEAGRDQLYGGDGRDILDGGAAADHMEGGYGSDIYYVDRTSDTITEVAAGGFDRVYSTVSLSLADLSNLLDRLDLIGTATDGSGNSRDNVVVGNELANTLSGGRGIDELWGADGNDVLYGGMDNDILRGGYGNDDLYGGADVDTFVFETGWGVDEIFDFSPPGGEIIDLSSVGAITDWNDLVANHLVSNGSGEAVIRVGDNRIILHGVQVADLHEANFLF